MMAYNVYTSQKRGSILRQGGSGRIHHRAAGQAQALVQWWQAARVYGIGMPYVYNNCQAGSSQRCVGYELSSLVAWNMREHEETGKNERAGICEQYMQPGGSVCSATENRMKHENTGKNGRRCVRTHTPGDANPVAALYMRCKYMNTCRHAGYIYSPPPFVYEWNTTGIRQKKRSTS